MWRRFFDGSRRTAGLLVAIAATLVAAWIAVAACAAGGRSRLRAVLARHLATLAARSCEAPLRSCQRAAFALVLAVLLFPAFEMAGLQPRTGVHLRSLSDWAFDPGLQVLLIALLVATRLSA